MKDNKTDAGVEIVNPNCRKCGRPLIDESDLWAGICNNDDACKKRRERAMSPEEYIREVDKLVDDYDCDDPLIKLYLGFRVGVIAEKHTDKTKEDRAVIDAALRLSEKWYVYGISAYALELELHEACKNTRNTKVSDEDSWEGVLSMAGNNLWKI